MAEEKEKKAPEMDAELKRVELELKQKELEIKSLELKERQANLQDAQERLDDRALRREQVRQRSLTNGSTLTALIKGDLSAQKRCNHHKGGNGQEGIVGGQGDDSQYAVIKHTFLNGDTWVRCMRCAKTWKPPIEENYYFDEGVWVPPNSDGHGATIAPSRGKYSAEHYHAALAEYMAALNFQTRNKPSSSYVFRFSDNGKFFRQITNSATLR